MRFAEKTEEDSRIKPQRKTFEETQSKVEEIGGSMVDPKIRNIWSEAVDLSEIRNVEDQTE